MGRRRYGWDMGQEQVAPIEARVGKTSATFVNKLPSQQRLIRVMEPLEELLVMIPAVTPNRLYRGSPRGNRETNQINKLIGWFLFDFFVYGSWEALDMLKIMPKGMGTFSDIEIFVLRALFFLNLLGLLRPKVRLGAGRSRGVPKVSATQAQPHCTNVFGE